MIEAIRPAVLLCWAGAETTEGMEVIFKTEHFFKGDGRCNKPSRYLLHWFHAHWAWEMPSHSLCSLKCSCPPPTHTVQQCKGKQGWTCVKIMGSGGLGFNFWANVLIYPGGRAWAKGTPHLLKAQAEVTDLTGLWHWEGLTLPSGQTAGKSGEGGLSSRR